MPLNGRCGCASQTQPPSPHRRHPTASRAPRTLLLFAPMPLDRFRFLLVNLRQLVARLPLRPQKLVQLRLNGLGIAMLRALDEKRHEPRRQGREPVPIDVPERGPGEAVERNDHEGKRLGGEGAEARQEGAYRVFHDANANEWRGAFVPGAVPPALPAAPRSGLAPNESAVSM